MLICFDKMPICDHSLQRNENNPIATGNLIELCHWLKESPDEHACTWIHAQFGFYNLPPSAM